MYKPENSNSVANEFARYSNFGLREAFIDALLERGDTYFHWDSEHPIGDKKVDSTLEVVSTSDDCHERS